MSERAAQTRKPVDSSPRHFLDLCDFEPGTLKALIAAARQRKKARNGLSRGAEDKDAPLTGKVLALIFEKPSTRTRISFDVGMQELGGRCIMLTGHEMQLGRGETIADTARVLSRYVDAIMIRTLGHDMLMELAGCGVCAGDQRADQALASLPGDGRRHDLRGEEGIDPRPHGGVGRRCEQCVRLLGPCGRALRFHAEDRDTGVARAEAGACANGRRARAPRSR